MGAGTRRRSPSSSWRRRACGGACRKFDFATGYLEFARPTIRDGLAALAARGAKHILAIPGMLFAASHVKNDLPWEMNSFIAEHPGIDVRLGRDLGIDPKLLQAAADRIRAGMIGTKTTARETLLVVVGRGTNDPDANSNISKLARMLWEGIGLGWAEVAFSGVAHPRVDAALTRAAKLGFRRIIVFPYFLFTGVLVKRIYAQTDAAADLFPDIEFVKAGYLRDHEEVLSAFCDRVAELGEGQPAMNCQLCKYRAQIIGYEEDAGRAAGRAPPSCARHRHRRASSPSSVMFDTFAMVDWSAATVPRKGRDSIWICWHAPDGERLENPPTRHAAKTLLGEWLAAALARGERILLGFDFPFGYPAGFAARLGLSGPPWRAVWDEIGGLIDDSEDNCNNRFKVAAELNRRVSGGCFPFWGCPAGFDTPFLNPNTTGLMTARAWPSAGWWTCTSQARNPAGSCWGRAPSGARL